MAVPVLGKRLKELRSGACQTAKLSWEPYYGAVGREMLNGALLGIRQVNESAAGFVLQPLIVDPGGG